MVASTVTVPLSCFSGTQEPQLLTVSKCFMLLISLNAHNDSGGLYITITYSKAAEAQINEIVAPGHMAIHGGAGIPGRVSHSRVSAPLYFGYL